MKNHRFEIDMIKDKGHEIGSHGHFHFIYKDPWRAKQDREISMAVLDKYKPIHYRAPKFSYDDGGAYANPNNHIGLLKSLWTGLRPRQDAIYYLHPFDLVESKNPPNLFCRMWYSRSKDARRHFANLVQQYPGKVRL